MSGEPNLSPEDEAAVERAMKRVERKERRERFGDPEKFDAGLGSWMTIGEEFSQ